jgi:hypothetical protein
MKINIKNKYGREQQEFFVYNIKSDSEQYTAEIMLKNELRDFFLQEYLFKNAITEQSLFKNEDVLKSVKLTKNEVIIKIRFKKSDQQIFKLIDNFINELLNSYRENNFDKAFVVYAKN